MSATIDLAVLDMAGTTVRDDGLVERAFDAALDEVGLASGTDEHARTRRHVDRTMGRAKREVFAALFPEEPDRARRADVAFARCLDRLTARECLPIAGAERAVRALQAEGVRVGLTTGFARPTRQRLLERLGWNGVPNLVVGPEEAGRGRPHPDMILAAVRHFGTSCARVAVVGDTAYDMVAGVRSGARVVAGVLTGAHDARTLTEHGATHVLESVVDLPGVVQG